MTKEYWIDRLKLMPHPEGGFYKETYRSQGEIAEASLPAGYLGTRNYLTSIFFLLTSEHFSAFHRLSSDELWFWHQGDPVTIHLLNPHTGYSQVQLGQAADLQACIAGGTWFAAEIDATQNKNGWVLVSCVVAPGFDFQDFELAEADTLDANFPSQANLIKRLTRS